MPSSQYVYVDTNNNNQTSTNNISNINNMNRRRSQRIRRKTLEKTTPQNNNNNNFDDDEILEDPDETMLDEEGEEETRDESKILLSDDDDDNSNNSDEGEGDSNNMEVDEDEKQDNELEFMTHPQQSDDNNQHSSLLQPSTQSTGVPRQIRGGAGGAAGYLTYDPLTSSTMNSTPFSEIQRRVANKTKANNNKGGKNKKLNTKEKLRMRTIADQMESSDDSDDDGVDIQNMSEGDFMKEVNRRRKLREAELVEKSQQPPPLKPAAAPVDSPPQKQNEESEDTSRINNYGGGGDEGAAKESSPMDSFADTQPWERELGNMPLDNIKQNDDHEQQNNAPPSPPQKVDRREKEKEVHEPQQQGIHHEKEREQYQEQQSESQGRNHISDTNMGRKQAPANQHNAPQKDRRGQRQEYQPDNNRVMNQTSTRNDDSQTNQHHSSSLPINHRSHHNVPQKDRRRQEYQPNYHQRGRQASSHLNHQHQSLPSYNNHDDESERNNSQNNDQYSRQTSRNNSHPTLNHRDNKRSLPAARSTTNPYHRKQPPPPAKNTAANVPRIALDNMRSRQQGNNNNTMRSISTNNNRTTGTRRDDRDTNANNEGGETWQEESFRSSLLDLLGSFPSNCFNLDNNQLDESMDENNGGGGGDYSFLFSKPANNNDTNMMGGVDSPLSTTSQTAASAQLHRKRLFDAASRSLARLAIVSRHTKCTDNRNNTSRSSGGSTSTDGESQRDFNPPSPRSLPSFMSVMNIHDDSNGIGGGYWGAGNVTNMLSSSKAVFSGQSVHGRNARSVQLSSTIPQGRKNALSSTEFSSWTSEQLAFGTMVLAAQVCHEASYDPNFNGKFGKSSVAESCRVAGFVQNSNSKGGNDKIPAVSSALVEASLEFLATCFACLEADIVYSVLKSTLKSSGTLSSFTVMDAISYFCPVPSQAQEAATDVCTIPALSLLTLSRGLEATIFVARHAASLDPSSACTAYSTPYDLHTNSAIDTGVSGGGVGWLSALGRDLGLKLEDSSRGSSHPRHHHLSQVAAYAYDFILEYDPHLVDEDGRGNNNNNNNNRGGNQRGKSRGSLYVDTQGVGDSQAIDALACRQPSVMKDRMFAAIVEYLSSLLHAGIVSGWLLTDDSSDNDDSRSNESNNRTVDRLCQKLFFVVETRARLRSSTNQQNTASSDPGDSEAVCAASLSLLILALPEHVDQSGPSSLSTSFRQMGSSNGSIDDLLHSHLMKKMVEMALSWQDEEPSRKKNKSRESVMTSKATSNAISVLSLICMVGGSDLIASQFGRKLENFLQNITEGICDRGRQRDSSRSYDNSTIDSPLSFLLQLHTGMPVLVRQFIRRFIEQQSSENVDYVSHFVAGLMHLSASKSFSVSSCASSLLRALIDGNPIDRTQDRLSELILSSFETEDVGSTIEGVLSSLIDSTQTSINGNISDFNSRSRPRMCLLGDLLGVCIHSMSASEVFAFSLSNDVLNSFADAVQCNEHITIDTLGGSASMSLLYLFASFVNNDMAAMEHNNDDSRSSIQSQQRIAKDKLLCSSSFLSIFEVAMAQGKSADMTWRAQNLQKSLFNVIDERSLAITITKASDSVVRKESAIRYKLAQSESDLQDLSRKYKQVEIERDTLSNSFHDQRLSYERQLELTKSEARMAARNTSQIHVDERRYAEEMYHEEREMRMKAEQESERLKREHSGDKARIIELEELLKQEREARQGLKSSLDSCKNELSTTVEELERKSDDCHDLQEKLSTAEEQVADLSAINEDVEANLEEVCSKLVNLATIFQSKEAEFDKYKAELRRAVNTANKDADLATSKYTNVKQANRSLTAELKEVNVELKEVKHELKEVKAHRADVQRLRKNQPTNYINAMHKDPKTKKKQVARRKGKENSFDELS